MSSVYAERSRKRKVLNKILTLIGEVGGGGLRGVKEKTSDCGDVQIRDSLLIKKKVKRLWRYTLWRHFNF